MNEKQMLDDLDERARAAANDLTTRAAARPVPAFDPDRATTVDALAPSGQRAPSRRPMLAVAAAVVVALLLAGTWFVTNDGGDTDVAEEVISTSIRPYLPSYLPPGLDLAGVGSTGGDAEAGAGNMIGPLLTFGPSTDDPRVGVMVLHADQGDPLSPGEEVAVGERTGRLHRDHILGVPSLVVPADPNRADGHQILVFSPTAEVDVLVRVAERTTTVGLSPEVAEDALPAGWSLVHTEPDGISSVAPMAALRGALSPPTHVAYFTSAEHDRFFAVSSQARPAASVDTLRLIFDDAETITVRGHRAVVGRTPASEQELPDEGMTVQTPEQWTVRWQERPGEVITVSGSDITRDELLRAADTLEPVGEGRWRELEEATALGDLAPPLPGEPETVELGRGRFDDGTAWVLRYSTGQTDEHGVTHAPDIQLDVALTGGSSSGSSGSSFSAIGTEIDAEGNPVEQPEEVFQATSTVAQGGRTFSAGLVRDDVARVEIRAVDGTVTGEAEMISAEGVTAWVAELTDDGVTGVALSADGTELGSHSIARDGDGSGSMGPSTTVPADSTIVVAPSTTGG